MKVSKENCAVFIKSESQLKEARILLEKYKEEIHEKFWYLSSDKCNYLQLSPSCNNWYLSCVFESDIQITIHELETILKQQTK